MSFIKSNNDISIYVHWPFCLSLCPYCDFNSHILQDINIEEWTNAYLKEIDHFSYLLRKKNVKTIFFGGGTPSLMPPQIPEKIIEYISNIANITKKTEITLEANPTSSERKTFKSFKNVGINRLSIGVQSFNDEDLSFLGRMHSSKEASEVINAASEIFDNFSFDLIYARPGQTVEKWQKELEYALSFASPHISLYQLTIEKGTHFYKLHKEKKLNMPSSEISGDLFDMTNNLLQEQGYNRYEISNYAKKGFESRHNLTYWRYDDYLGIGPGAYSRFNNSEIVTYHNPNKWIDSLNNKGTAIQRQTKLPLNVRINEMVMMCMRIKEGLDEEQLMQKTGKDFWQILNLKYLEQLKINNYILQTQSYYNPVKNAISYTEAGLNLHSYLTSRLIKEEF